MTNPEPRWASRKKACAYVGVSDATFYRYVSAGIFVRHDIGGGLYDLNQLDTAIRRRAKPGNRAAELAGVIARIRTELPAGKPLIPLVQVHAILDKVAADLGAGRCTEYGIGDHDCAAHA